MTRAELVDQLAITVFGVTACALVNFGLGWGAWLGLVSQVFWWRTSRRHGQHGIAALSLVYTAIWALGAARSIGLL